MSNPSPELFVRGKFEMARYEPGSAATGRRLTLHEVLEAYGEKVLPEIDEHLSAVLLRRVDAIENALRTQRTELGVTREQLASAANVSPGVVKEAETFPDGVAIRDLEHMAFVLGLDPARISSHERAGADPDLAVRLGALARPESISGETRLSPRTVLRFSEAASIIVEQSRLQDWLGKPQEADRFEPSPNYVPPVWRQGYELAAHAREQLGLGLEPIRSMRELAQDRLGIPIIQVELPPNIAGATVSVSGRRGILLNTSGPNTNVWIRRTTLAHELAHLLFDPDERLKSVQVDGYEEMQRNAEETGGPQDDIKQRANAFAVEFLAPRESVRQLSDVAAVTALTIQTVMSRFGIGRTAARNHVGNAWHGQAELPPESSIRAVPTDADRAAESFTQDFFPIEGTTGRRRGRFAVLVAEAVEAGLITADTAAQHLACSEREFEKALPYLLDLT